MFKIILLLLLCASAQAGKIEYQIRAGIGYPGSSGEMRCIANCGYDSQSMPVGGSTDLGSSAASGHQAPSYASHVVSIASQGFATQTTVDPYSQRVIDYTQNVIAAGEALRQRAYDLNWISRVESLNPDIQINSDYGVLIDPSQIDDVESVYELRSTGEFRESLEPTLKVLSKIDPLRSPQYTARDYGRESVKLADESYVEGNHDDAEFYRDLAQGFTELALGLHPVSGVAQSAYEFIRGKSFIGGHELSTFQRGVAFAGILTFGQARNALKLGTLLGKFSKAGPIAHIVESGLRFLKTSAGKAFSLVKREGKIAEDVSYKFFERKASTALNFPKNHEYVRVLPRTVAEEVREGLKPLSRRTESFISTADDVKGLKDPVKLAERLGLYDDDAGKILHKLTLQDDVVMKFKIDRSTLAEYERTIEGEYNMFIAGVGETVGGAREYIVKPDMLGKLLKDGKIKPDDILIMNIGDL